MNLKNYLRIQYKKSFDYIKESRNFIYSVIGIFFVFALIGFFVPASDILKEQIFKFIQELLEKTQGMSGLELAFFIFWNNIQSSFFGIVLGVFFGIFPIIASIANGYLLGFVSRQSVGIEGILVLWRLFPHGIFELPAIFISFGLGLKLWTFVFQKNKTKAFKEYFLNSLRVFLFVILLLLIIAAIIEGSLIFFFK